MASDPSVYGIFNRPTVELLDPYTVQARQLAIRNALAAGQMQDQQIATGALELEARRRAMADEQATRAALTSFYGSGSAPPAGPGGAAADLSVPSAAAPAPSAPTAPAAAPAAAPVPRPRVPTMGELIQHGVPPPAAAGLIESFQKIDANTAAIEEKKAAAAKAQSELNTAVQEHAGEMASAIIKSNYNPAVRDWQLAHFAGLGAPYAQMAQQVKAQIEANPDSAPGIFQSIANSAKGAREAAAREGEVTNQQQRLTAELPGLQAESVTKQLTAQGKAPIQPAEQQRIALERQRVADENARLRLEAARFQQQYGDPTAGATPGELYKAKLIANGDIPAPSSRSKGYDRTLALVMNTDPTYTEARYLGKKQFKTGPDANNIVSITTALAHLDNAQANSAKLGFEPTLGANWAPDQRRYHADVDLLQGEVGKLIKNGVVAEGEANRLISNLTSVQQRNRDAALDELKNLMGGKLEGIAQKYRNATNQDLPLSMFDKATQARLAKQGLLGAGGIPGEAAPQPTAAPTPAAQPAAANRPAGSVSVTDPNGGVHVFPNQAAADNFKRLAGIR